jgi:hypothetical protein
LWERDNAHWFFEGGKHSPDAKRTPAGEIYNRYYYEARQMGYADPFAYAQRALDAEILPHILAQQQEAASNGTAQAQRAAKDLSFIKRATAQPNRSGGQQNGHKTTRRALPKNADGMPQFDREGLLRKLKQLPADDLRTV